jgi:hypothetical protein
VTLVDESMRASSHHLLRQGNNRVPLRIVSKILAGDDSGRKKKKEKEWK